MQEWNVLENIFGVPHTSPLVAPSTTTAEKSTQTVNHLIAKAPIQIATFYGE